MAKPIDLRTYLLLERAFVRRLQRSWQQKSAPLYAKITQACLDHKWDEARRLVPDLDMAEVGTENREWITYMLLSCAVFGASTVSRHKPSFVGVGTFDTFLKQVTNNMLQYLEFGATSRIQAEALQLIAEDEAKTKALKVAWDESKHPRDKQGQFTDAMIDLQVRGDPIEGGGPERAKWVMLNKAAIDADDAVFEARKKHYEIEVRLVRKYKELGPAETAVQRAFEDPEYQKSEKDWEFAQHVAIEAERLLKEQEPAMRKEVVTNIAHSVAKQLGFPPSLITVVHEPVREFTVGGRKFFEAAHYDSGISRIQLNAANIDYHALSVKGVVAHEISHAMYDAMKKTEHSEFQRYLAKAVTPDKQGHTEWFKERFQDVAVTGAPVWKIKPEYREELMKEFPAAAARSLEGELFKGLSNDMIKENGHSAYAKAYWSPASIQERKGYESAITETVAEIMRYVTYPESWAEADKPAPDSSWVRLTRAMHSWYVEQQRAARAAIQMPVQA